ncbi:EAL domain-containing protein [Massilia sp. TW-1]|uniref:EAL domain-containing protein n=1 Tax=Telluria antibiotica TaxID=2717319 RepID=A0ABX0P8R1_9BURK|nr:EAL domain-containing protein [Telluria antibiotica]
MRLSVLTALLAVFMGWLVLGHAALLPWDPRWYLTAHTAMEVFSVVVAMLVFSTGWHGIGRDMPIRVALLSPAALAVGLLDFGHLMSMPGMPGVAGPGDAGRGIEFWLLARAVSAAALLAAAFAPRERTVGRRVRGWAVLAALALAAFGYWLAVADPMTLPATYVPGRGLTPFKIGCEVVLIALNALAALFLLRRALVTGLRTDRYLAATAAVMALGGVSFASYARPDDVVNLVGHVYKVIAYLCLHRAIWVAAVQAPYLRLQRSERSLAESEAGFRSLMECAPDAILLVGGEGRITMMNARAESLFGVPRETAAGLLLDVLVPPGAGDAELDCRRLYGPAFPADVRRAVMPGGQQVAIVRDLSERRRLERALVEQLTHDALTGLPNRNRILEALDEAIACARHDGRTLAVLVFDLHEFRKINSGYGYAGGDDVLRECVVRLSGVLAGGDMLARQGGNEFIVVQKHAGQDAATALAERLLEAVREPFLVGGQRVFLAASVGIALLPDGRCCAHELLQMAQVAMAGARAEGPARYRFHTDAMALAIRERVDMESLLRHAIERNQFALQYQPRVELASGAVLGVEALVRWRHPVLGLVPPARFIPLAEETGLIDDIDMWVLDEACTRASAWRAQGLPPLRVSVNLSARQFQQAGLAQRVQAALEKSGLPPGCLEIEITESTVMRDTAEAASVLRSLKALGVALSIDDFGTGYSSLSYLKRFPIDVLKIDRSFISDVTVDANDAAITRAIIALAHTLNLEAVAEGVETAEQVAFLRENGCDEIQGYYFSPPVWPEQIEELLDRGAGTDVPLRTTA